jgi:DNA-binding NarL/FixJ family response regulator
MDQRTVRVVVGRGDPSTGAALLSVLLDEGFDVIGEASTSEALAVMLREDPPDVIVLDDTIGIAAAQVAADVAPDAKLVVLWPPDVLPTPGAVRADAADVTAALRSPARTGARR